MACPVGAGGRGTLICHSLYTVVPCWPRSCYCSSSDYTQGRETHYILCSCPGRGFSSQVLQHELNILQLELKVLQQELKILQHELRNKGKIDDEARENTNEISVCIDGVTVFLNQVDLAVANNPN